MSTAESLQFDFKTINDATNNFSEENRLGEGGFGAVYKGRLENGQETAVKRLSRGSLQDFGRAWKLWADGTSLALMDSSLRDSYSKRQALRCIHIAYYVFSMTHFVDLPWHPLFLCLTVIPLLCPCLKSQHSLRAVKMVAL
uniref:Uncharacterized protein n=1 Tax=Cucumis melo TaxID=3656 RepID=A0A9I9CER3_CUCME